MAKKTRPKADLNDVTVQQILRILLAEFRERKLGSQDLVQHYKGLAPARLKELCCTEGSVIDVDFDLALRELTAAELVKTGPMQMYDNKPGGSVFILGFYSKNEYSYLTQEGYKAAVKAEAARPSRSPIPRVHISGGSFHQSQIGIGDGIIQTLQASQDVNEIVAQLRTEIANLLTDETKRHAALAQLDQLSDAPDKPTKVARYFQFMSIVGDHITVLSPLLQLLLHKLS